METQRAVTWSFDVFLDLNLNKRLSKQSIHRWFEKSSRSFWRHCDNKTVTKQYMIIQCRPFIARFIIANILKSSILISLHNMLPFELTKDTPYLALSGELWSVFYEYFNINWPCYKGFILYYRKYDELLHPVWVHNHRLPFVPVISHFEPMTSATVA